MTNQMSSQKARFHKCMKLSANSSGNSDAATVLNRDIHLK